MPFEDFEEIEFNDMFDLVFDLSEMFEGDGEAKRKLLLVKIGVAGKDFGRRLVLSNSRPLSV